MKKIILLFSAVWFAGISIAQTRKLQQGGSNPADTTINDGMTRKKTISGNKLLHTVTGKYTLYATYANSKVVGYYLVDKKGRKYPASIRTKQDNTSARNLKCYSCYKVVDADTGKWVEDCDEIPCPEKILGEKATTNARH